MLKLITLLTLILSQYTFAQNCNVVVTTDYHYTDLGAYNRDGEPKERKMAVLNRAILSALKRKGYHTSGKFLLAKSCSMSNFYTEALENTLYTVSIHYSFYSLRGYQQPEASAQISTYNTQQTLYTTPSQELKIPMILPFDYRWEFFSTWKKITLKAIRNLPHCKDMPHLN